MIQLKDLGTFESVPHIVTDIVTGNISALENALANGWDINIPIEIGEYSEHTPLELALVMCCLPSIQWLDPCYGHFPACSGFCHGSQIFP